MSSEDIGGLPTVPVVVVLSVLETGDVSSTQQQFLVLDNEQRSTDAPSVRVDTYLSVTNVTHHRHLDTHTQTTTVNDNI